MYKPLLNLLTICFLLLGISVRAQKFPDEMRLSPDGRRLITGGLPYTDFYEQSNLKNISLVFSDPDYWDNLENNYGHDIDIMATMYIDGILYDSVGVRFKGSSSYSGANQYKKSFNITLDAYIDGQDVDGYTTLNLNNCEGDPSYMAEVFFETQISKHVPSPKGNFAHLFINGMNWGLYANVQQVNKDFVKEWFLTNNGAMWRAKRPPGSPVSNGSTGDSLRSMYYLGPDTTIYTYNYDLKFSDISNPYTQLRDFTQVMATVSNANMESVLGDVLDIDRALWFIASENAFGDDDGYVFEGRSDYKIYLEAETGRFVPQEFDGNGAMDDSYINLDIFKNANKPNYALLYKLLNNPPLRQRYLAHMRTLVEHELNVTNGHNIIDTYFNMINSTVQADPIANYPYSDFLSYKDDLKDFITDRRAYILSNLEINKTLPVINNTTYSSGATAWLRPQAGQSVIINTHVTCADGLDKVTLYHATGWVGKFSKTPMYDDGGHNDGAAGDGVYGATISGKSGGTWVRFYIEATSDNSTKTVVYDPVGAEHDIYTYLVEPVLASDTSIVINEIMASNTSTAVDNAGQYDDWIELYNRSANSVNVSNYVITDNEYNLTKFQLAPGTTIPAGGYLIIWPDEDGSQGPLHANFKMSSSGEHLILLNSNGEVVDDVTFGVQQTDMGYARVPNGSGNFVIQGPTFNSTNTPALQAIFSASVADGCAPLSLNFTNLSHSATSYTWDFGDGNNSSTASPSHIYTGTGTFLVTLTAINGANSHTDTMSIYVHATPAVPTAPNQSRCGTGTVNLSASSANSTYWYSASTGGTLLSSGANFTTPSISASTTYYVEAGLGSCRSARVAVQAVVDPIPASPSVSNVSRCGPGSVVLNATSPSTINWFSASSGGSSLHTGNSYSTLSISSSTTYYVEAGTTCKSARVSIQAIINSIPSAPSGSDVSRCGTGTVTLSASGSGTIRWYAASSGGAQLGSGTSFTSPSISASTTYYAESDNGCPSATRTPIQAIIDPIPVAPASSNVSRCGSGTLSLTATGSGQLYWYSSSSGGTLLFTGAGFTTPSISSTTTYYVETGGTCRSSRTSVQAIISPVTATPVTNDVSRCNSGTVTLTASSASAIAWYSAASGGTLLSSTSSFTTPTLASTTIYYVSAGTTCPSIRIPVQAIVTTTPPVPLVQDGSRCGSGSITLSGTSGTRINWYNSASGGTLLDTGATFNTPNISSSTTYYADAGVGCNSARVPVVASITPLPASPVVTNGTRCGSGSVVLAASSAHQLYWFSQAVGGSVLDSGTTFTTPSISNTTSYYVETGTLCRSLRVAVVANITAIPAAPSVNNASRCNSGSVTLSASSSLTLKWYDQISGGILLATGNSYTTGVLVSSQTYYVQAGDVCLSARVPVQAIITSPPAVPVLSDGERCGPGSVSLSGTSPEQINWYDAMTGGSTLGSGSTFNTPVISVTTTFYADAGLGCNSARVPVIASIIQLPATPSTSNDTVCGGGSMTLIAVATDSIFWFDVPVGGIQIASGSNFTTPNLSNTATYYVESGDNCRSIRIAVDAVIIPYGQISSVLDGSSCGSGQVTLSVISSDVISWYDTLIGGNILGSGTTFIIPSLSSSHTYYAVPGVRCPGSPVAVNAIIHPALHVDIGLDSIVIQSGQSVLLDPGAGYANYQWSTGDSTQSISVNSTGYYSITVIDTNGCFATDVVYVEVMVGVQGNTLYSDFNIYPNPANESLVVSGKIANQHKGNLFVYSIEGKVLHKIELISLAGEFKEAIDLKDYAPGMYVIQIRSEDISFTSRFVIER